MAKKVYAARGLLDFQVALNVGGAIVRLCFSGGTMGSNGVIPAKYVTDNPVIQRFIEDSTQFKNNRIYLYQTLREKDTGKSINPDGNAKD